ncbi:Os05g0356750 [Oryza sativa Japonica Group]|uniref:Os05g0356750 protein n=1 Tax=Oryza sativa subsp. japonica TaxID=39947 RepID=A0A0P0WLI1_ORYSJ|nr:Os05g0356750 [Oryza sativa Japonica Group]
MVAWVGVSGDSTSSSTTSRKPSTRSAFHSTFQETLLDLKHHTCQGRAQAPLHHPRCRRHLCSLRRIDSFRHLQHTIIIEGDLGWNYHHRGDDSGLVSSLSSRPTVVVVGNQ